MRFWEIDAIRGLAVIGMVIYHFWVDLEMFYGLRIGVYEYPVVLLARIIGVTFVFLLGVSAYMQFEKSRSVKPFIKRGLYLWFWALVISGVTYLILPDQFIFFGILHFMGSALILLIPLTKVKSNSILFLIGLGIMLLGLVIQINVPPTLDFYPVIPWMGLVVWGFVCGKVYKKMRNGVNFKMKSLELLEVLGRNSLMIYLVHQPVLLGVMYLIGKVLN